MKKHFGLIASVLAVALLSSIGLAQEAETAVAVGGTSIGGGLVAIGIGLAFGLAALGVGIAQSSIGSAASGAVAEKPELFGRLLIYILLPETVIVFGLLALVLLQGGVK
jgi:V/A-type H+/Na+-transporting ATPase subunit K